MRILMMSHGYPPTLSGVTLVVQRLARAMVKKGHAVSVITASEEGPPNQEEDEGVLLFRVRSTRNPFWKDGRVPFVTGKGLLEIIDQVQPDIIHAHDGSVLSTQLHRQSDEFDIPQVSSCHYLPRFVSHYFPREDFVESLTESVAWQLAMKIQGDFDHLIFATQSHRDEFLKHGLAVPTTIISNGVDTELFHPRDEKHDGSQALKSLPQGPRVLFVSRLAKDKDIEVLIRAMPPVWENYQAHLLLAGEGDDRERLEELTAELGLGQCVRFLGFVPDEVLPALYRECDLFAIASTCEVQSLPTLEAAATGLPIISAKAAALPELVEDGVNGFLVPPRDPKAFSRTLSYLLENPDLARQFGRASLAIGRAHANQHTYRAHEKLYEYLISGEIKTKLTGESMDMGVG